MIVGPRTGEQRTVPTPTVRAWWALTGWGVALLGVGFGLGLTLLCAVLAPIAAVMVG